MRAGSLVEQFAYDDVTWYRDGAPYPFVGTPVTLNGLTEVTFTGIPPWVTEIMISIINASTNGTSNLLVQIGDAGGIEGTAYNAVASLAGTNGTSTGGFVLDVNHTAAHVLHGHVRLNLAIPASFQWTCGSNLARVDTPGLFTSAGSKSLSQALDRVRLTTVGGTDTFDAGIVNIVGQ